VIRTPTAWYSNHMGEHGAHKTPARTARLYWRVFSLYSFWVLSGNMSDLGSPLVACLKVTPHLLWVWRHVAARPL